MTPTAERFYSQLVALTDGDSGPLAAIVAGLLDQIDSAVEVISDSDAGPGWSALMDVDRCPSWGLRWLGQTVGVRLPPGVDDADARLMIADEAGFSRGTLAALVAVCQRYLRPGHTPLIVERDPDPYHVQVSVFAAWLLGATYRELSTSYATYTDLTSAFPTYDLMTANTTALLGAALQAAKPAGLILTLTVLTSATYSYLTAHYATYTDLTSAFPTYDLMTAYTP